VRGIISVVLCVLCSFCASATVQVLYAVDENQVLTTFDVDAVTGVATQVGSGTTLKGSVSQMFSSASTTLLYVRGFSSSGQQYIWVYRTNTQGVPQSQPIQSLRISPLVSNFLMHPSGKSGYALLSWIDSNYEFNSQIVFFLANVKTGKLKNTGRIEATYGPDYYFNELLVGISADGLKLYDAATEAGTQHANGAVYSYHPIDPGTGNLSPDIGFYDAVGYTDYYFVSFTDSLIASFHGLGYGMLNSINIYSNTIFPTTSLINCTVTMLSTCGDDLVIPRFDPSSQSVLLADVITSETVIARVDLVNAQLSQTASISGVPTTQFSPDGHLIYAVNPTGVDIYPFDPSTGLLSPAGSVSLVPGAFVFASQRQ
jgi:hypothetical protein